MEMEHMRTIPVRERIFIKRKWQDGPQETLYFLDACSTGAEPEARILVPLFNTSLVFCSRLRDEYNAFYHEERIGTLGPAWLRT